MAGSFLGARPCSLTTANPLTNNPGRQGTYSMWDNAGHKLQVSYGNVESAQRRGYKFDTNKDHGGMTPQEAYQKDRSAQGVQDFGRGTVKNVGDALGGIGSGALHTLATIGYPAGAAAHAISPRKFPAPNDTDEVLQAPNSTSGKVGRGIEQAAEFALPGGAEEKGAAKLATLLPWLGKGAGPVSRIAASALSSGAVNAAQGGSPVSGAAMGAGGRVVGEALHAAAPAVTEFAQGIKGSPGHATGKAILTDLPATAVTRNGVRDAAQNQVTALNNQAQDVLRNASERPNQARGLLTSGNQEVPLAEPEFANGTPSRPVILTQADRPTAPLLQAPSAQLSSAPGHALEFPEQLSGGETNMRPNDFGKSEGMGQAQYIGEVPGETGGRAVNQGVLIRPPEAHGGPIPSMLPNNSVSLLPARNAARQAIGRATAENAENIAAGGNQLLDRLSTHFNTGEPIPENVTPIEAWDLRKGLDKWQPEGSFDPGTTNRFARMRNAARGELNTSIGEQVPEYQPIMARESALIPAIKPPRESFGPGGRYFTPAGAAIYGAYRGHENGGGIPGMLGGAAIGGALGTAAPALATGASRAIYNPEVQRTLVPAAYGGLMQLLDRSKNQDEQNQ